MFRRLIIPEHLQPRTILFDSWYASVDKLKLVHRSGGPFFTTLKNTRMVSLSRQIGYQHLTDLAFKTTTEVTGLAVKLKPGTGSEGCRYRLARASGTSWLGCYHGWI